MKRFFDPEHVESYSRAVLNMALDAGADSAAVQLSVVRSSSARFAVNKIIQNMAPETVKLVVAVSVGRKETAISMNVMDDDSVKDKVREAVRTCNLFPDNPEHMPPIEPKRYGQAGLYFDPEVSEITQKEKALIIRDVCAHAREKHLDAFGTFSTSEFLTAVSNSNGLFTYTRGTDAEFTITMRTEDGLGSSREARSHHALAGIPINEIVQQTADWAKRSRKPADIPAGDYTVVLSPTAVLNYFMPFFWTLDARKIAERRSALTSHFKTNQLLGKRLFNPLLNIRSRVAHPDHPRPHFSFAFSMESMGGNAVETLFSSGLPVEDYPIVENGVLRHVFASRYWAKEQRLPIKAFPTLIEFGGSEKSLETLIANTQHGLLINSFWYIRFVDPNHLLLTGLTRDGIFKIENGVIKGPVKNLRFNESPLVSMTQIREIGKPERRRAWYTTALIPSMVIDRFTFSVGTDAI